MRKLYTSTLFLLAFGLFGSFSSFGQIVANTDDIFINCSNYGELTYYMNNILYNDTINDASFPYTDVSITIIDNPYQGNVDINIDPMSPNYGFFELLNPSFYGNFTIAYQICQISNPTNCDIGYATLYNYGGELYASPDDFNAYPINNITGGSTPSVLNNDFETCGSFLTAYFDGFLPPGFDLTPWGVITVEAGTTPGTYIINYFVISDSGAYSNSYAIVVVTGNSDIIANYDDFSASNYPNTTTASILNNDTLNGNPINYSQVTITPLNIPSGFSINTNGTINIGNVAEGTYNVPYQICDIANPASCYINYAYVVVFKNRILGKVKFDANNNGCDASDAYLNNIKVKNVNGATTYTSYTRSYFGNQYYLIGDVGTNTVSVNLPSYFTVTPANQVFNFTTPGTTIAPDFCIAANSNVDDLEVVLIPLFNAVPGLPVLYDVWYKNNGSTTLSGQVTFTFDSTKMSFLNSNPSPNATASNTLTYNYSNLAPFESRIIKDVKFLVATPPTVNSGNVVTFSGSITPIAADATPTNNTSSVSQTVVNSQDPNDIFVHEGASITLAQAQQNYLHYTIRFQNVGTSEAINVKVVNDLDPKLDWSTFELVSTSHDCRVKNNNGHNEFLFEGINLPGTDNEPLSHGYISYKIKPISSIAVGNVIPNSANIYFDFNAPIATNVASTTVVNNLKIDSFAFNNFNYYPNPVKNSLSISNGSTITKIEITSLLGQKIMTKKINDLQTEINLSSLSKGVYFVKVMSEGQEKTMKIIKE